MRSSGESDAGIAGGWYAVGVGTMYTDANLAIRKLNAATIGITRDWDHDGYGGSERGGLL